MIVPGVSDNRCDILRIARADDASWNNLVNTRVAAVCRPVQYISKYIALYKAG
jgi:hypothetical protein